MSDSTAKWATLVSTFFVLAVMFAPPSIRDLVPIWARNIVFGLAVLGILFGAAGWLRAAYLSRIISRQTVFDQTCERLKNPRKDITTFQSLYAAGAADLKRNRDIIWICNKLVKVPLEHPFAGIDKCVLRREWLAFLKWGKRHPEYHFDQKADYLDAAQRWGADRGRPNCVAFKFAVLGEVIRDLPKTSRGTSAN
jgi:hypothetical protein